MRPFRRDFFFVVSRHGVDQAGRKFWNIARRQRIFSPEHDLAAALFEVPAGSLHELDEYPARASVLGLLRAAALLALAGEVRFVGCDVKVFGPRSCRQDLVVHVEDELPGCVSGRANHVVVADVFAQGGELGVLEHVGHVRRPLQERDDLDVARARVGDQLAHLIGAEGARCADDRVLLIGEFVFDLPADGVDLELGGAVEVLLHRLEPVLVMLRVPVNLAQFQIGPVLDAPFRQQGPRADAGAKQLEKTLDAVEEPGLIVARHGDSRWAQFDEIRLAANRRLGSGGCGARPKFEPQDLLAPRVAAARGRQLPAMRSAQAGLQSRDRLIRRRDARTKLQLPVAPERKIAAAEDDFLRRRQDRIAPQPKRRCGAVVGQSRPASQDRKRQGRNENICFHRKDSVRASV